MTRTITQESVVAFLNYCWQTERVQATYNTQTVTGCWRKAHFELHDWAQSHRPRRLQTLLTKWHERATRTGPMTIIIEQRTETWQEILEATENLLAWTDEQWHPYTSITIGKEGYGLYRYQAVNGEQTGWIIPLGGTK